MKYTAFCELICFALYCFVEVMQNGMQSNKSRLFLKPMIQAQHSLLTVMGKSELQFNLTAF